MNFDKDKVFVNFCWLILLELLFEFNLTHSSVVFSPFRWLFGCSIYVCKRDLMKVWFDYLLSSNLLIFSWQDCLKLIEETVLFIILDDSLSLFWVILGSKQKDSFSFSDAVFSLLLETSTLCLIYLSILYEFDLFRTEPAIIVLWSNGFLVI